MVLFHILQVTLVPLELGFESAFDAGVVVVLTVCLFILSILSILSGECILGPVDCEALVLGFLQGEGQELAVTFFPVGDDVDVVPAVGRGRDGPVHLIGGQTLANVSVPHTACVHTLVALGELVETRVLLGGEFDDALELLHVEGLRFGDAGVLLVE